MEWYDYEYVYKVVFVWCLEVVIVVVSVAAVIFSDDVCVWLIS